MVGRSTRWTVGALLLALFLMIVPGTVMASPTEPARASHGWLDSGFLWTTFVGFVEDFVQGMKIFAAPSYDHGDSATGGGGGAPNSPPGPDDVGTSIDPNGTSFDCDVCS